MHGYGWSLFKLKVISSKDSHHIFLQYIIHNIVYKCRTAWTNISKKRYVQNLQWKKKCFPLGASLSDILNIKRKLFCFKLFCQLKKILVIKMHYFFSKQFKILSHANVDVGKTKKLHQNYQNFFSFFSSFTYL